MSLMTRFHSGTRLEITFRQRFGRSLLVNMLLAAKDRVVEIRDGGAGALKSVLSRAKADALLSWLKGFVGSYGSKALNGITVDEWFMEAIDALANSVAEWDETLDTPGDLAEEKESPLRKYNALVGNPYVAHSRDQSTWDALYQTVFARATWAMAFTRLAEVTSDESWRIAPHSVALHLAEIRRPLGGPIPADKIADWAAERDRQVKDTMKGLIDELTKQCVDSGKKPNSAEETLGLALELSRNDQGRGLPESYLAGHADVAATNVAIQLGVQLVRKNVEPKDSARFAQSGDAVGKWVLGPLLTGAPGDSGYEAYFPVHLQPTEAFECPELGVSFATEIPKWVRERLGPWARDEKLFLRVEVLGASSEIARRIAARRLDKLFDVIFGLDALRPFIRRYDPEYSLVVSADGKKARTWGPKLPGLPETRAEKAAVGRNVAAMQKLELDGRAWCKQVARTLHLLRLSAEANEVETRFVHLWRALECLVGHLTGMQAEKFHKELLAQSRCFMSQECWDIKDPAKRQSFFDREYQDVLQNLDPIEDIRNKWALHTGDERTGTLHEIDHETLTCACDWLADELGRLFDLMVHVALIRTDLQSRKDVHGYLEHQLKNASKPSIDEPK